MRNREIIIIAALILAGAIGIELYTNFTNPQIDYTPGTFTSLLIGSTQIFDYYKDGNLIGTYAYILTNQTSGSETLYTLKTVVDAIYQEKNLTVNSTYKFRGEAIPATYEVDFDLDGVDSKIACKFLGGDVVIDSSTQGRNQTVSVPFPENTVIIDNNNPAHWELLMKSFIAEVGKKYRISAFVPQGAGVQGLEFGVDTSHQFVSIGTNTYECVVAREPNFQITLFFYHGNLIQFRNDADGIIIVKRMP